MEEFFYVSSQVDEVELLDLVMANYSDMSFCMRLSASEFLQLCIKLLEKRIERRIWEQWLTLFPYMNLKYFDFMPFEAYKDRVTGKSIDMRSNEEIIAEIEALHHMNEG